MRKNKVFFLVALFFPFCCLAEGEKPATTSPTSPEKAEVIFPKVGKQENKVEKPDSEEERLVRDMCAKTKCQRNVRITLKRKDGTTYDRTFPAIQAVVQDIGITVVAGQTIYLETDMRDGKLMNFTAVDAIVHPEKTFIFHLEQMKDGGMMLSTKSPYKETIKFQMGIMPLGENGLFKTSSCPITGGSFEMWAEPIFQIVLRNPVVLGASDPMICEF